MSTVKLAGLLAAAVALAHAEVDVKRLRWRAEAEMASQAEFAAAEVRGAMSARTEAGFADLRIVGPDGTEVGWMMEPFPAAHEPGRRFRRGELRDVVKTPGGALQFVMTAPRGMGMHQAVEIGTEERLFQRGVVVETSEDGRAWDVAGRGVILQFKDAEQQTRVTRVRYAASGRPYVRVTVEDWPEVGTLEWAELQGAAKVEEKWDVVARVERPRRSEDGKGGAWWEFGFAAPALEGMRVAVETETERFARWFVVETSRDGERWQQAGSGVLYRVAGGEDLSLGVGWLEPRRVRLRMGASSDAPVEVKAVRLEAPVRRVIFPARAAGRYEFYLGRRGAAMPEYDVQRVWARTRGAAPALVRVGDWGENPDFESPGDEDKPVSERYPGLLTGVLGVMVAGMGWAAWRLLRKAG